jgi:hypothetical protein
MRAGTRLRTDDAPVLDSAVELMITPLDAKRPLRELRTQPDRRAIAAMPSAVVGPAQPAVTVNRLSGQDQNRRGKRSAKAGAIASGISEARDFGE